MTTQQSPSSLVLLVHSGTRQALHQTLSLAMLACAEGDRVAIALFYDGLAAWCGQSAEGAGASRASFGDGPAASRLQRGFTRLGIGGAEAMLQECRDLGGPRFKVVACGGSVEALGLSIDELLDRPLWFDDVVGLPTIWRWIKRGRVVSV